jgi:hypothetical protein
MGARRNDSFTGRQERPRWCRGTIVPHSRKAMTKEDDAQAQTEALVEAHIERSLAPHRGRFPPEVLEEFAEELRVFLMTHPVASRLLARVRPVADRTVSGDQALPGATEDAPAAGKGRVG